MDEDVFKSTAPKQPGDTATGATAWSSTPGTAGGKASSASPPASVSDEDVASEQEWPPESGRDALAQEASPERLQQVLDDWTNELRATVREHPLAALAAALTLGMLIARLSR